MDTDSDLPLQKKKSHLNSLLFILSRFTTNVISRHFTTKVISIQLHKHSNQLKVSYVRNPNRLCGVKSQRLKAKQ